MALCLATQHAEQPLNTKSVQCPFRPYWESPQRPAACLPHCSLSADGSDAAADAEHVSRHGADGHEPSAGKGGAGSPCVVTDCTPPPPCGCCGWTDFNVPCACKRCQITSVGTCRMLPSAEHDSGAAQADAGGHTEHDRRPDCGAGRLPGGQWSAWAVGARGIACCRACMHPPMRCCSPVCLSIPLLPCTPALQASASVGQAGAQQQYGLTASEQLKAEGNRLHSAKQFGEAADKYRRAISNLAGADQCGLRGHCCTLLGGVADLVAQRLPVLGCFVCAVWHVLVAEVLCSCTLTTCLLRALPRRHRRPDQPCCAPAAHQLPEQPGELLPAAAALAGEAMHCSCLARQL